MTNQEMIDPQREILEKVYEEIRELDEVFVEMHYNNLERRFVDEALQIIQSAREALLAKQASAEATDSKLAIKVSALVKSLTGQPEFDFGEVAGSVQERYAGKSADRLLEQKLRPFANFENELKGSGLLDEATK